ncbi:MAG: hypothetical protein JST92_00230 [Deltaproteobacteria bacterium]|nr:hypothetical protein [Deltaproteobacteria bacterium]
MTALALAGCAGGHATALDAGADGGLDSGPVDSDGGPGADGGCAFTGLFIGGDGDDLVQALLTVPQGVLVGGYVNGVLGNTNIEPDGDSRGFVRLIDTTGAQRWETTFETSGSDSVEALAFDGQGHILVAGRTTGSFPGFTNGGQQDLFVALLDAETGAVQKLVQRGDERPQHPRAIAFTAGTGPGRGPSSTGASLSPLADPYVPSNYAHSWENPFVARFTDLESATTTSYVADRTSVPDLAEGLARASATSTDFLVSGVLTGGPSRGLFLRRVGLDGSVRYQVRLSGTGLESPGPLIALDDGTLWMSAGWIRSTGTSDLVVFHLRAEDGAVLDAIDFPTPDMAEQAGGFARDAHGDLWIAGSAGNDSTGLLAQVTHLDSAGAFVESWTRTGGEQDLVTSLAIDACGHVLVGGSTEATANGKADGFVLRAPFPLHER